MSFKFLWCLTEEKNNMKIFFASKEAAIRISVRLSFSVWTNSPMSTIPWFKKNPPINVQCTCYRWLSELSFSSSAGYQFQFQKVFSELVSVFIEATKFIFTFLRKKKAKIFYKPSTYKLDGYLFAFSDLQHNPF
jgi:hypothetical protein